MQRINKSTMCAKATKAEAANEAAAAKAKVAKAAAKYAAKYAAKGGKAVELPKPLEAVAAATKDAKPVADAKVAADAKAKAANEAEAAAAKAKAANEAEAAAAKAKAANEAANEAAEAAKAAADKAAKKATEAAKADEEKAAKKAAKKAAWSLIPCKKCQPHKIGNNCAYSHVHFTGQAGVFLMNLQKKIAMLGLDSYNRMTQNYHFLIESGGINEDDLHDNAYAIVLNRMVQDIKGTKEFGLHEDPDYVCVYVSL